jgi:teichuronic acid biosynthesis glycosyltransferase TuaH
MVDMPFERQTDGAGPPTWGACVVIYAGSSWDGPPSSEKQLALSLRRYTSVLYVDPPAFPRGVGWKSRRSRLLLVDADVARLSVVVPPASSRAVMRQVAARVTDRAVTRTLARLGGKPAAIITAAVTAARGPRGRLTRVFYGTDDFVAGAALMGLSPAWLERQERRQIASADVVLAVTAELADKWRPDARAVVVFPNGCDDVTFANTDSTPPAGDVALPYPIAGFLGYISDRIDVAILEAVADRGCSLLLVGPVSATSSLAGFAALIDRPNVQWVGPKPFEQLPSYLRHMTVGVTPYADSPFNRASYPLKTLEYLAGGRAVVSADLPAARTLPAEFVTLAGTPSAFADAVERGLLEPPDPGLAARRRAFAAANGWGSRGDQIARLLSLDHLRVEPPG